MLFDRIGTAVSIAVSLAALGAAAWGGYHWGGRKVASLEEQLHAIETTADTLKKANDEFGKKLSSELAAQARDHETKLAELKQRDAQDMAELQTAKTQAQAEAARLRTQAGAASGRIDTLQKQIGTATTADEKARLEKALADATAERDQALRRVAGVDCMNLPVPATVLTALNRTVQP